MIVRDSPATAVLPSRPTAWTSVVTALLQVRELNVLTALLVVVALISFSTPYFLTTDNLMGVFRSFSLIAIMSIGMVMVIITGGIDLSVGSVMGLSSLVTALGLEPRMAPLRSAVDVLGP